MPARMRTSLFAALVTTLVGELFLLIGRIREQSSFTVVAALIFAAAFVLWVLAVRDIRRTRR